MSQVKMLVESLHNVFVMWTSTTHPSLLPPSLYVKKYSLCNFRLWMNFSFICVTVNNRMIYVSVAVLHVLQFNFVYGPFLWVRHVTRELPLSNSFGQAASLAAVVFSFLTIFVSISVDGMNEFEWDCPFTLTQLPASL